VQATSRYLGGRVLRARTPAGIAQEIYVMLTCYRILPIAITDAIEAAGGIDPDRGSFTIALNAARDLLTQAANVIAGTVIDLIGAIGNNVAGPSTWLAGGWASIPALAGTTVHQPASGARPVWSIRASRSSISRSAVYGWVSPLGPRPRLS
jgi:hypothetical protein